MKSLSQSEYGELRSLYSQVYAPKFETVLDELTDQEVDELTEEVIEEVVEEFFVECLEEGWDIESVEETLCESLDTSLTMLNEVSDSYYAGAVKSGKAKAAKAKGSEMIGKVKTAVKKVGSAIKSGAGKAAGAAKAGAKAAYKGANRAAGYAAGAAGRAASTAKSEFKKGCERDIRLIDDRLRVLEKKMWSIAGALAVVSVMISPIGQRILSQVLTPPAQTSMMVPGNTLVNGSN